MQGLELALIAMAGASATGKLESMRRQAQQPKRAIDVTGLPEEAVQALESVVSLLHRQPDREPDEPESLTDPLLGLFREEPELLDQIVEDALTARETQPLRLSRE